MNINAAIKKGVHTTASFILSKMTKIVAMMLILNAVLSEYVYLLNSIDAGEDLSVTFMIGIVLQIVLGTMILIDFSNNFSRAIGLYAISVAINRIISNLSDFADPRGISFAYAFIMMIIALNMMYTGFLFVRGRTRSRGMMFSSILMLGLTMGEIYIDAESYGVPPEEILTTYPSMCVACVMYFLLFIMVGSERVRDSMPMAKNMRTFSAIRRIEASGPTTYTTRRYARTILKAFDDRSDWIAITDGGPVECEFRCVLYNHLFEETEMILQKWKDHDRIFITIPGSSTGSMLNAFMTSIDSVTTNGPIDTCDTIVMYGDHGSEYMLKVRDEVEEW